MDNLNLRELSDDLTSTLAVINQYQTKTEDATLRSATETELDTKASLSQLAAVEALIPDVSALVCQSDVDISIAAVTNDFIPRTGGIVDGHFIVNKADVGKPAFDVSGSWQNSKDLFKLKSYSPDNATATFGATDQWWQYAWNFAGSEEFAWVHDGDTVFSIAEDGPACYDLILAVHQTNTTDGRSIANKISVRNKLAEQDAEITNIKNYITADGPLAVNARNIHYGDTAPPGIVKQGDIWFDSQNLRLNIQHNGFWISPDRTEDAALKSGLFNAVNSATDFDTLKANLLSVLS